MALFKSSEFKGLGFNYDPQRQPFFKALVKENPRMLSALKVGKKLLKAIEDARPSYRGPNVPEGINVALQPVLGRTWNTPGLGGNSGRITDQAKYDASQQARDPGANNPVARNAGKLIPGITAKTQVQEDDKKAASDGTGSTALLLYSNTEMLSDTGTWFIPHITMGHELIHRLHCVLGEMDPDNKTEEYKAVGIKEYENGQFTENKLRAEAHYAPGQNIMPTISGS